MKIERPFFVSTHKTSRSRKTLLAIAAMIAISAAVAYSAGVSADSIRHFVFGHSAEAGSGQTSVSFTAKSNNLTAPASLITTTSGSLLTARSGHTATALDDGRVLITGGDSAGSSEIYDPASGLSVSTGNLNAARSGHTATRLADGRILITGGTISGAASATSEIYDPTTSTFSIGPSMAAARSGHTATTLSDGRIFIAGGDATGSAEIYDPSTNGFSGVSSLMSAVRSNHSAVKMADGRVLIAGGDGSTSAEIFNPADGSFTAAGNAMTVTRSHALLRVLPDGKVQIIGGSSDGSMEVYDPAVDTIGAYAHVVPDSDPCANLINYVLAAETRAALIYSGAPDTTRNRSGHTITELTALNQAVVIGGTDSTGSVLSAITVFNSSSATITTDKLDYQPGDTATISGTGYQPAETVRVMIHEDPHTPQERGFDAIADAYGNFSGTYVVQDYDLNMKFVAGSRGLTSGVTAQTTFTDANPNAPTAGPQSPDPVVAGNSATYTISVSYAGNSASCTVNLSAASTASPAWPTPPVGGFFTFSPSSLTSTGATQTSTLTVNTPASMATNTYKFRVTATIAAGVPGSGCQGGNETSSDINLVVLADTTSPTVSSINRALPNPTNAANVTWQVTFSENVTGVDSADFALVNTGLTGSPLITGVTQVTPSTYNVTASTGNGTGSLGLNLVDDDTIIDAATNKLGGTGTGNSNFTGQVYNIDRTLTPHITADNKTYDGDTTATLSDCSFTSALTVTESVNVSCTSPTFAGAGVGSHNVSANISLTGSDASKYVLSSTTASTTANITSKAVTATLAAADKIYDGNATEPDANMNCVLSGVAGIDTLNAVCTATAGSFNSPNVATANHVTATVTIGGTAAGNYTLGAAGTSINSTSATATAHILKATPTLSTTGGTFTYDGNPHPSVGTALGVGGVTPVGGTFVYTYTPPGDSTAPVNASATPYSVSAAFTATDPNYNNGTPAVNSITINRASSTTVILCPASVTFNALAQTPCTATATGAGSLSVGVNVTYGNNTNAGTATADATYSGDSNHNGSTATQVTFTIAKAVADCSSIAGYSGTYDGAAHNATGNCTGVAGDASAAGSSLDLGQPFTNFPGGTATWVFTGGTNYTDQTGAVSITIGRANATINVVGFTGEYDRVAHNATGTATGVLAENLNGLLSYSAPFTDVPGGTATWTFNAGNANNNYNSASGTVSIEITPKNLTIDGAVAQNKIYDGNATASVTFPTTPAGVIAPDDVTVESSGYSATFASADVADNIDVTVTGVTLAGAQAGNYTVSQPTGLKANITKLNLTISGAVAQPKIYDGNTDAVVDFTGYELHTPVSGDVVSLDTSGYTAHFGTKDAGTAIAVTVTGVMLAGADAGNYTVSQPAGLTADINRRTLTASIVGNPTRTYTGDDIAILAPSNFLIANLVSGEGFTVTETAGLYNSPDVTAANTVTAALDATDFTPVSGTLAANYDLPTSASGSGHITPATPLVHVTGGPFTYDANPHPATVTVTGVLNEAVSETPPTVTYSPPGDTTVPVNAGTYNVGVSFTSANSNYTNASGSGSIVINKAISTTTVTFEVGPYTYRGSPFTATASATGVGGLNQMLSPTYSGDCTNVTVPDGCTASATFDGDDNHFGSNSSGSITITKAASTTTVTCPTNETYTSFAIEPCTAKVTGAGGLNIDPFTVSYTDNINAGTAHAGASYSGDQNHDPSSDAKTFTIDKAPTTTTVTCGTGPFVYNGSAFEPCTAMVTGPVLSQSLIVIYANNTDAGTASASSSYSGDANLIASNDSKNFTIDKAPSTVTVTCPTSEVYSGSAQTPCTVSVTGVNLNLTPNPDYSDNVVVGTATASYTFGGDANHTGSSGSKQFQITKAPVTATAGSGSATYDNLTHTPSGCSVTGTYTGDLTCSNVPNTVGPDAGATTITPSVTGSGTENFDITPVNGSYTINQASSTTTVTCPPSQVYTGSPLTPCSASVTGAGGLSLALTPSYGNNTNPGTATANASYAGDANHTGSSNSANFSITNSAVANVTVSSAVINENGTATLTISFTDADAAQTHTGTINWGDGSSTQSLSVIPANIYSTTVSRTFLDDDPTATSSDLKNVSVTVTDGASTATGGSTVTINNVAPTVTSITGAPTAPVQINTPVSLTVNFADTGTKDTHTCSFNWDDMTPSAFVAGTVTETVGSGVGTCTGSKTFTVPGVYTILTSVQDDDTGSVTKGLDTQYVVVFDPNGGFVTGGGWIMSPAGASTQFPTATGKANFGFVSKYKKGSNIPDGQTEFQFQAGNLNFHSSSYDVGSLVISSYKAQYKGVGDINGVSGYKFILTAYDGNINGAGNDGIDKFRIKILDANNNVVYDNRMNASDDIDSIPMAISGGSISIQKAGK